MSPLVPVHRRVARTVIVYLDGPGAGAAVWFWSAPPELYPPFFPPGSTTTLTKRRLYSIFLKARPRGFFFLSAFSALGVCAHEAMQTRTDGER